MRKVRNVCRLLDSQELTSVSKKRYQLLILKNCPFAGRYLFIELQLRTTNIFTTPNKSTTKTYELKSGNIRILFIMKQSQKINILFSFW